MSDYFRNLQNIATEQDRAKFATVVAEYRRTLQQLPKLQQEMDSLLAPGQLLDYIDLTKNVRPKLEQAARFLFEIDQLPAELRNTREVAEFVQSAKANMTLQTVGSLKSQLSSVSSTARQRLEREKTRDAEQKVECDDWIRRGCNNDDWSPIGVLRFVNPFNGYANEAFTFRFWKLSLLSKFLWTILSTIAGLGTLVIGMLIMVRSMSYFDDQFKGGLTIGAIIGFGCLFMLMCYFIAIFQIIFCKFCNWVESP